MGYAEDGTLLTKRIEEIEVGDWVLSRSDADAGDGIELKQVTAVHQRQTDHLRELTIDDGEGSVQTIRTTDEHPFYVEGRGWVSAGDLQVGDVLLEVDGSTATVTGSVRHEYPHLITVYNFEVEGDQTYFVQSATADGGEAVTAAKP